MHLAIPQKISYNASIKTKSVIENFGPDFSIFFEHFKGEKAHKLRMPTRYYNMTCFKCFENQDIGYKKMDSLW